MIARHRKIERGKKMENQKREIIKIFFVYLKKNSNRKIKKN